MPHDPVLRHFFIFEFERDLGYVAFQPSAFYGRFVGELVYSLNDAPRRLEGLTSYYVMSGDGKTLQTYCAELENGLRQIGKDLDGIVGFCKRKLAPELIRRCRKSQPCLVVGFVPSNLPSDSDV